MVGRRPEHSAPADIVYNASAAFKYRTNNRMNKIQKDMAERALELLRISPILATRRRGGRSNRRSPHATPKLILDIGCGIGLSGEVIEQYGHYWQGIDISPDMIAVAFDKRAEDENLDDSNDSMVAGDIGCGLPYRPATFDAVVSISTLQWLCNADRKDHIPQRRLKRFFESLFMCLARGGKAVFQLYPENDKQMHMIMNSAKRAGFGGGVVLDYPNSTTAKKYYLVLQTDNEHARMAETPVPVTSEPKQPRKRMRSDDLMDNSSDSGETSDSGDETADEEEPIAIDQDDAPAGPPPSAMRRAERKRRMQMRRAGWRPKKGTKSWIRLKKEQQRMVGKKTANDSKYTGRKRQRRF